MCELFQKKWAKSGRLNVGRREECLGVASGFLT